MTTVAADPVRDKALQDYRKKLLEHKEVESRLKESENFIKNFVLSLRDFFYSSRGFERAHETV